MARFKETGSGGRPDSAEAKRFSGTNNSHDSQVDEFERINGICTHTEVKAASSTGNRFKRDDEDYSGLSRNGNKYGQDADSEDDGEEPKKWWTKKRIALIAGGAVLLVLVIALIVLFLWKGSIDDKMSLGTVYDSETVAKLNNTLKEPTTPSEPYYILLLGSDSRDASNPAAGRSDTQILVRVDPEATKVSMLSIPRDTKVELEGYGTQKINAAFAYGGPAGAVTAVNNLCGVEIAHYVEIDFDGLISLVDALGGVTVNVPLDISYDGQYLSAGEQHLNGQQALLMSRSRNFPDGDFQRMKNQRILMQAIAKDILHASPTAMPGLISGLADCVSSDVNSTGALDLVLKLQGMDTKNNLYMATIPSRSSNEGGVSYVVVEEEPFAAMLEKFKTGQPLE
jgi:LCP family protein required for cell wall assembly